MSAVMSERVLSVKDKAFAFAKTFIASRTDLHVQEKFPEDLWEDLARNGLHGLGIPVEFGGSGGDYLSISAAGHALAAGGNNLGFVLSWFMHQLTARFFLLEKGNTTQHRVYLPDMSCGKITACAAISEPQGGAHPKYLTTTADHTGTDYIVSGRKTFLTNAAFADLFIVFAITGMENDRKRFSAIIVPRHTQGLTLTEPLDLGFLKPCPHGGIIMEGCRVSENDLLGNEGIAYEDMALPFREVEDALMMGPISGGIRSLGTMLVRLIKDQAVPLREDLDARLGEIEADTAALEILAYEAAAMLGGDPFPEELSPLLIFCRRVTSEILPKFRKVALSTGIRTDPLYENMANDLERSGRIAANVANIKQKRIGRTLLA